MENAVMTTQAVTGPEPDQTTEKKIQKLRELLDILPLQ